MSSRKRTRQSPPEAPAPDAAASVSPGEPEAPAPPPAVSTRRRVPWGLLALALGLACIAVLVSVSGGGRVLFAQDVELTRATVTREVVPGATAMLTLHFHARHPLDADDWVFVHVESQGGALDDFRVVRDAAPDVAPTRWGDQDIVHTVSLPIAGSAAAGRYAVFVGLYDRDKGTRLAVLEPRQPDDRVLAAWIDVVAADADASTRDFSEAEIHAQTARGPLRPLMPWLAGIGVAAALASWLAWRRRGMADEPAPATDEPAADDRLARWLRRVVYLSPGVPFVLGILVVLEFVKDDAYISFRYAHNLVTGQGLVFNHGERVEGFTNFLWVLVIAPFEALGWDLFQVCEVLGTILGVVCLVTTARLTEWIQGEGRAASQLWGAFWLASSSSYVLWSQSGLEQPLGTLLPMAGAFLLWTAREAERGREKRQLIAGLVMGAACMTRPELHLLAILVGLPLVVNAVRTRTIPRADWLYVAGILAVTVPCHTFRYFYYGSLIPNTFYAKTSTSSLVWREGLKSLQGMFVFNHSGALAILAPLAFASRRRLVETASMALIAVAFMAYIVLVGVDEMQWHRLYLPALPFLCVLAALGAQNLVQAVLRAIRHGGDGSTAYVAAYAVGWAAVLLAARSNFAFTYKEQNGFNGHGDLAGTFHPDLGKFLVRHERPGGLVAFQDMGSTPYHAPDIDFLDFVGLVDRTVAHARHDMGLHAFMNADDGRQQTRFEADMRDYFFARKPEWAILTIYTPHGDEEKVRKEFDQDPTGGSFGEAYRANSFQWGISDDPRFRQGYVPVRTWPRGPGYYLALWRRRDLWEETPREVVLDAPPANLGGVQAKLEGGLELLGSEVTAQTLEHHEVFVTTWWRLPGPMPRDLYFFVHFVKAGTQFPGDHVPGDWMRPADRWHEGEILEDRTLVQLPPLTAPAGTYRVLLGAYQRSTGKRLPVESGPNDGDDRILLGSVEVKPLEPIIHQLIPPTRVDVMRKYPDRIVDSHRAR
jgi:arabinofuranosyltransferase